MKAVDPDKLYRLVDAARLIPSHISESITPNTLRVWIRKGIASAIRRTRGSRCTWYLRGSEILRLVGEELPASSGKAAPIIVGPRSRSGAEREDAAAKALEIINSL